MHLRGDLRAYPWGMALLATSELRTEDTAHSLAVAELERAFATGPESLLRDAYDLFGSLVYSLCRRSVDDAAAADITQEVFIAAWKNRHRFDPARGGLAPWLTGIARNKVIDHFRARGREDRRVEQAKHAFIESPGELEDIALRMLLVDAIDTLPERAQTIISMAFFEDLTHVEISARTGIPLGTVKSDIRRSLERLRHGLGYAHG